MLVAIVIAGYTLYHKQHRSVENEKFIEADATDLFKSFETDETNANLKYLDNVVQVNGIVSEVLINQAGESIILLKTGSPLYGISCTMKNKPEGITPGMNVDIRGICTGYLSDVIIIQGMLVSK